MFFSRIFISIILVLFGTSDLQPMINSVAALKKESAISLNNLENGGGRANGRKWRTCTNFCKDYLVKEVGENRLVKKFYDYKVNVKGRVRYPFRLAMVKLVWASQDSSKSPKFLENQIDDFKSIYMIFRNFDKQNNNRINWDQVNLFIGLCKSKFLDRDVLGQETASQPQQPEIHRCGGGSSVAPPLQSQQAKVGGSKWGKILKWGLIIGIPVVLTGIGLFMARDFLKKKLIDPIKEKVSKKVDESTSKKGVKERVEETLKSPDVQKTIEEQRKKAIEEFTQTGMAKEIKDGVLSEVKKIREDVEKKMNDKMKEFDKKALIEAIKKEFTTQFSALKYRLNPINIFRKRKKVVTGENDSSAAVDTQKYDRIINLLEPSDPVTQEKKEVVNKKTEFKDTNFVKEFDKLRKGIGNFFKRGKNEVTPVQTAQTVDQPVVVVNPNNFQPAKPTSASNNEPKSSNRPRPKTRNRKTPTKKTVPVQATPPAVKTSQINVVVNKKTEFKDTNLGKGLNNALGKIGNLFRKKKTVKV